MAIKIYTKEYAETLANVFAHKQYFLNTFGGQLQVIDGVKDSDTFMTFKVSDTDVVVQAYDTGVNVGFGTGTGASNRFGARKEIVSVDVPVEYETPLAIHEGVDDMTVNDNAEEVIAERTELHAIAWTEQLNTIMGTALSTNAYDTLNGDLNTEGVRATFNEAYKRFIDNQIAQDITWTAYVTADIYAILVDDGLTTTAKQSATNIDTQTVEMYKGFVIEVLPTKYFADEENILFSADNVGVVGVGVQVYRIMDSEDFAGVAIQGAGKAGKYIPEKNKQAILKASLVTPPEV